MSHFRLRILKLLVENTRNYKKSHKKLAEKEEEKKTEAAFIAANEKNLFILSHV